MLPLLNRLTYSILLCRPVARVWTAVLLLGTCLLYCARVAMPICAVSMAEQFSWTKRESGMVLGSFFWGYCFTQVFGGYVSDRWEMFAMWRHGLMALNSFFCLWLWLWMLTVTLVFTWNLFQLPAHQVSFASRHYLRWQPVNQLLLVPLTLDR